MEWLALLAVALLRAPHAFALRCFDADAAVNGLIGLQALRGDVPLYYWGQGYMTPVVGLVAAPFLWLLPSARVATQAAPWLLHLVAAWMLARLIARASGSRAAGVGTILAIALLPAPLSAQLMAQGVRTVTVLCGVLVWTLFLGDRRPRFGLLLGIAAGVGWWNEPSIALYLLPVLGLWWRASRRGRDPRVTPRWTLHALAGFALGVAPHVYGVRAGLAGIRPAPEWARLAAPGPGIAELLGTALPALASDLRPEDSGHLRALLAACALALGAVLAVAAYGAHRRTSGGRRELLILADGLALAFLPAWVLMGAEGYGARRFALLLWPAAAVWVALGAAEFRRFPRAARRLGVAVLALAWSWSGMVHWERAAREQVDVAGAVALLDEARCPGAFANYWASNLITLETRERLIVAQLTGVPLRHRAYWMRLERTPRAGYLFSPARFPEDAGLARAVSGELRRRGLKCERFARGAWELLVPSGPGLPLPFLNDLRLAPGRRELLRRLTETPEAVR